MTDLIITLFVTFLAGVGVGALVLGVRLRTIVSDAVANVHYEYAQVEVKTKDMIAAGVTRIEEIKKVL